jgi:hypothetical protein
MFEMRTKNEHAGHNDPWSPDTLHLVCLEQRTEVVRGLWKDLTDKERWGCGVASINFILVTITISQMQHPRLVCTLASGDDCCYYSTGAKKCLALLDYFGAG